MKFSNLGVGFVVAGGVALAATVSLQSAAPAVAKDIVRCEYARCFLEGRNQCLPRTPGGMVYLPSPDTPEAIAFDMCLAEVEQRCTALYGAP